MATYQLTRSLAHPKYDVNKKSYTYHTKIGPIADLTIPQDDENDGLNTTQFTYRGDESILTDINVQATFHATISYNLPDWVPEEGKTNPYLYVNAPTIFGKVVSESPSVFPTTEASAIEVDVLDHITPRCLPWHQSFNTGNLAINGANIPMIYDFLEPILRTTDPDILQKLGNHHVLDITAEYVDPTTDAISKDRTFDIMGKRLLKGDILSRGFANNIKSKVWYEISGTGASAVVKKIFQKFQFETTEKFLYNGWNIQDDTIQLDVPGMKVRDMLFTGHYKQKLFDHVFSTVRNNKTGIDSRCFVDVANIIVSEQAWKESGNKSTVKFRFNKVGMPPGFEARTSQLRHVSRQHPFRTPLTSGMYGPYGIGNQSISTFNRCYIYINKIPSLMKSYTTLTYKQIERISITYGANSNLLEHATPYELWERSKDNGLDIDLNSFLNKDLTGMMICLTPDLLKLESESRVADDGQFSQFSIQVHLRNDAVIDNSYQLNVFFTNSAILKWDPDNTTSLTNVLINPADLANAVIIETSRDLTGGNLWNWLKRGAKGVLGWISNNHSKIGDVANKLNSVIGDGLRFGDGAKFAAGYSGGAAIHDYRSYYDRS